MITTTQILEHYGVEHQTLKAVEELAELAQVLIKICQEGFSPYKEAYIEEMADVQIMLSQMMLAHEDCLPFIRTAEAEKLERLERRIATEKERGEKNGSA